MGVEHCVGCLPGSANGIEDNASCLFDRAVGSSRLYDLYQGQGNEYRWCKLHISLSGVMACTGYFVFCAFFLCCVVTYFNFLILNIQSRKWKHLIFTFLSVIVVHNGQFNFGLSVMNKVLCFLAVLFQHCHYNRY